MTPIFEPYPCRLLGSPKDDEITITATGINDAASRYARYLLERYLACNPGAEIPDEYAVVVYGRVRWVRFRPKDSVDEVQTIEAATV